MNPILGDLNILFTTLNTPMGVAVLLILGFVIIPKIPKLAKIFGVKSCEQNNLEELKPALLRLATGIEKISGNDLSHLKQDIIELGNKMNAIDQKFIQHDAQAKAILSRTDDIWDKLKQ